jgi:DNA (cytosine-5)-methyltransferase 1
MNIGSLFSGAGALDIAVEEVFDATTSWYSEINPAASKVLAHNNPDTPNIGDITCINWDVWPEIHPEILVPVDILCGGWPCQPFSVAGKKKGIHDHRALWPYVARAVRTLRPRIVVLENVPAVLTAGEFDRVANDLAACGYDFAWTCFRASDVGAPHRRERIFVVAHADNARRSEQRRPVAVPPQLPAAEHHSDSSVTLLPTPTARDGKGRDIPNREGGKGLPQAMLDGVRDHDGTQWGKYEPAIRRWENLTRPAPPPTVTNSAGKEWLNPEFSEWLMGWPQGWVTDPAIGISRNDQLKIVGNGVCPQQAAAALRYLLEVTK